MSSNESDDDLQKCKKHLVPTDSTHTSSKVKNGSNDRNIKHSIIPDKAIEEERSNHKTSYKNDSNVKRVTTSSDPPNINNIQKENNCLSEASNNESDKDDMCKNILQQRRPKEVKSPKPIENAFSRLSWKPKFTLSSNKLF